MYQVKTSVSFGNFGNVVAGLSIDFLFPFLINRILYSSLAPFSTHCKFRSVAKLKLQVDSYVAVSPQLWCLWTWVGWHK